MGSITRTTAFHEGERLAQHRIGVLDKMAALGPRVIREFMPDQHRDFFRQLPYLLVATLDQLGQPWASILVGNPGFIDSPDDTHLTIRARALRGDPLEHTLAAGHPIGLLGLEAHTRRRNRANGSVVSVDDNGFSVKVLQSFGNCPKYIQARQAQFCEREAEHEVYGSSMLDTAARALIARSDTFFIATTYPEPGTQHGADISHRGGKPGFMHVVGADHILVPDYSGNLFFNTIGNLLLEPRAGLLVIDFSCGDLLYLAVDTTVIWEGAELSMFAGAQRLLKFRVRETRRLAAALPLNWGEAIQSPHLHAL